MPQCFPTVRRWGLRMCAWFDSWPCCTLAVFPGKVKRIRSADEFRPQLKLGPSCWCWCWLVPQIDQCPKPLSQKPSPEAYYIPKPKALEPLALVPILRGQAKCTVLHTQTDTHTHTHVFIYIYKYMMYLYKTVCVCMYMCMVVQI